MSEHKVMFPCFMCDGEFQMGPHIFDGETIRRYQITVCRICYNGNWDGWGLDYEQRLIPHLKKNDLPVPERNEKGWLPRN